MGLRAAEWIRPAGESSAPRRRAVGAWLAPSTNHSEPYRLAEMRWDTPIAANLARRSVASWLDEVKADEELRATATGLRGFFLADPEELSFIALVDQFAADTARALARCIASRAATSGSRPPWRSRWASACS